MNAWTPPAFDDGRTRELDQLIREQQPTSRGGRPPVAREGERRQTQFRRRITYLRRGGRHAEADAEIAANDQSETYRRERDAASLARDRR